MKKEPENEWCAKCPRCECAWIFARGWVEIRPFVKMARNAKCPNCGNGNGLLHTQRQEDIDRAVRPKVETAKPRRKQ